MAGQRRLKGANGGEVFVNRNRYDTRDPLKIAMVCEDCGGLVLIEQWAHDAHEKFHTRALLDHSDALIAGALVEPVAHVPNSFPPKPPPFMVDDITGAPV